MHDMVESFDFSILCGRVGHGVAQFDAVLRAPLFHLAGLEFAVVNVDYADMVFCASFHNEHPGFEMKKMRRIY
jgi:hypothetical protein